jgi:hypothetical protein
LSTVRTVTVFTGGAVTAALVTILTLGTQGSRWALPVVAVLYGAAWCTRPAPARPVQPRDRPPTRPPQH